MKSSFRFLLLLLAAWTACAADRPNILFFAVDDLRPEFGAYGASDIKSLNLDRIAKAGVTFTARIASRRFAHRRARA